MRRRENNGEILRLYYNGTNVSKEVKSSLSRDRPRFLDVLASSPPVLLDAAVDFSPSEVSPIVLSTPLSDAAARLCSRIERNLDF